MRVVFTIYPLSQTESILKYLSRYVNETLVKDKELVLEITASVLLIGCLGRTRGSGVGLGDGGEGLGK